MKEMVEMSTIPAAKIGQGLKKPESIKPKENKKGIRTASPSKQFSFIPHRTMGHDKDMDSKGGASSPGSAAQSPTFREATEEPFISTHYHYVVGERFGMTIEHYRRGKIFHIVEMRYACDFVQAEISLCF